LGILYVLEIFGAGPRKWSIS